MAQVYPFRAYRYNPAKADFRRVLTQPYDKITPAMQEKYYAADPHNLITVEKGRVHATDTPQDNVYTRAAAALNAWMAGDMLVADAAPCFYAYLQEYTIPGTQEKRTRVSFIGAGKLEEYEAGVVFRHERTLTGPKADRLELLRHTQTHTGQIFMIYSDASCRVDAILREVAAAGAPATDVRDEYGVAHRLWPVSDAAKIAEIQKVMAGQKLVIADGHHRYETAINYRNERRAKAGAGASADAPYERTMMTFVNTCSKELTILPTHRVVANVKDFSWEGLRGKLAAWFEIETLAGANAEERAAFMRKLVAERARRALGVYAGGGKIHLLKLKAGTDMAALLPGEEPMQRGLDVVLLHRGILEQMLGITQQAVTAEANLTYEREAATAMEAVDRGAAQAAFLLNAVDADEVMRIATAGGVMPQKSTDFFPKMLSGIALYRVDG
ncbi:MAG: DUF1015 domain-containing protein [Acidobacteriia bacterium]|nr:DUF1015 domain-containing protein [Terriglobia bacterium]